MKPGLYPNATYLQGDLAQAATCGRRDECTALAYTLRQELERLRDIAVHDTDPQASAE